MSDQITVSSLDPRDEAEAAVLLTRAFHDDPLQLALVPDRSQRERLARFAFGEAVRHALEWGECYGAWQERRLVGTALWLPPGTPPMVEGTGDRLRMGWQTFRLVGRRSAAIARAYGNLRRQHPKRQHWFLSFMGVEDGSRGLGAGTRMLSAALARVDADGLPAYLETFNERTLPLYRRAGFEVSRELRLGKDLPTGWQMWRAGRLGLT